MENGTRKYLGIGILFIAMFLECGVPPDQNGNENGLSDNQNENTSTNGNDQANDNDNGNSLNLMVSLGEDREVEAGETVYLEAHVAEGKPPYWYLWKYYLPLDDQSSNPQGVFPSLAPEYTEGLNKIEVEVTTDTPLLRVKVEVLDEIGQYGTAAVVLTVLSHPGQDNENDNSNGNFDNENDNDNDNTNINENGGGNPTPEIDFCPDDPDKMSPGVCGCGVLDTDSDGDGTMDCDDDCPSDANKTSPGVCGCGVADSDSDGDGTLDCSDGCPNDANKTDPGVCGCGVADQDLDEDDTIDLNMALATSYTMSLFEGSLRLDPGVCGGVPPYSYSWTPATYLEDPGFPGGGGGGAITSSEVDFTPPSSGNYAHTLTVTDSDAPVTQFVRNFTITVNSYSPLVADAGEDQAVVQGALLDLVGTALGGSGNYSYSWGPSGPQAATFNDVPTSQAGDTTYTFTATDTETSEEASDTVRVVVLPSGGGSCVQADYNLGVGSARLVAYDGDYGSYGQAIVASNTTIYFIDLSDGSQRATLNLPSDAKGLVVDSSRRRAYATTRLSGQFTRSVQIIEIDTPQLLSNVGLTSGVAAARGMAVIPSSGKVLVAVSGSSHGLMLINPSSALLESALQNIHHTGSFSETLAVAVLEQGGLEVAVVANGSGSYVTLVPLDDITFTPDDPTGGGQPPLPQVSINGGGKAIVGDPANSRVIVGWNNGSGKGRLQVVDITSNSTGSAGSNIELSNGLVDQGLANDPSRGEAYAATGSGGAAVANLAYGIVTGTLQAESTTALSVASETGQNTILIVGIGPNLSERCP